MIQKPPFEDKFLIQLHDIVQQNMHDEQFGVSELADAIGMSRSNLLRKVKGLTGLSVSQFIRNIRLEKANELLQEAEKNVSEISFEVGFASTSYFVKCFREYFGHPPGEARELASTEIEREPVMEPSKGSSELKKSLFIVAAILVVLVAISFLYERTKEEPILDKSIAVLPFKNDSGDSSNVYFINGLMESTLTNLQRIGDLRVISRTSAEKYRNTNKSIPEIAKELGVSYFVEGSGQKIGDRILLNIQLIEASSDKHLWAEQYESQTADVFKLQNEVAKNIAAGVEAVIRPEELEQITKVPTQNLLAYDNFLKGYDQLEIGNSEKLDNAIPYFHKAIELDDQYADAYAALVVSYYYKDIFQKEKKFTAEINDYAALAMKYDDELPGSHVAKALTFMQASDYRGAIPHLEKALEYNPNSNSTIQMLADLYANYVPNTAKYLEYALMGIQLDIAAEDSITVGYTYLHLCNALIQTGFVDEALYYANRSLDYDPNNPYVRYVRVFMLYAKNKDEALLRTRLIREWEKDTTRVDILQEIGKISYFMRDYETSAKYYDKFINVREALEMDVFRYEHVKMAYVYEKVGQHEKAKALLDDYRDYIENSELAMYEDATLAAYYAYKGDVEKTIEHWDKFSEADNFQFWIVLFENDPLFDSVMDNPAYQRINQRIEKKFWDQHNSLKNSLKEKGLI